MHQLGMKSHTSLHQRLGAKVSASQQQLLGQKKKTSVAQASMPPPNPKEEKSELEK